MFEARVELPGFTIEINLYMAPLGSYDVIIGMNWLREHRAKVDCFAKTVECVDDLEKPVLIQGVQREVKVRQISAMQFKRNKGKGCQMFAVKMEEVREYKESIYFDDMLMHTQSREGEMEIDSKEKTFAEKYPYLREY